MKLMAMELVEAAFFTIHGLSPSCRLEGRRRLRRFFRLPKGNPFVRRSL